MDCSRNFWRTLVLIALPAVAIFLLLWASLVPTIREEGTLPICYGEYGWPMTYLERSDAMEGPEEFDYEWRAVPAAVDLAVFTATVLAACWLAWRLSRLALLDRLGNFQIRLSTLLVISLTIGMLQWPNFRWTSEGTAPVKFYDSEAREKIPELFARQHLDAERLRQEYQDRLAWDPGFRNSSDYVGKYPAPDWDLYKLNQESSGWPYRYRSRARCANTDPGLDWPWNIDALLLDLLIDLGIVLAVTVLWQSLIATLIYRILGRACAQ